MSEGASLSPPPSVGLCMLLGSFFLLPLACSPVLPWNVLLPGSFTIHSSLKPSRQPVSTWYSHSFHGCHTSRLFHTSSCWFPVCRRLSFSISYLGRSCLLVPGGSVSLETEQVLGWFPMDLVERLASRSVLCVDVDCLFPSYKDTVLGGDGCRIGKQRRREGRCPAVTLSHFSGSGDSFYNTLATEVGLYACMSC